MTSPLPPLSFADLPIPARAGIGLKFEHIHEVRETTPDMGWFEIHAENFMSPGGPSLKALEDIRSHYPLSVHGVGLSLGGGEPLNQLHLHRLKTVIDRFNPGLVSEHLAWCAINGTFFNDLLPIPYDKASLRKVIDHVSEVQDVLKRQILIENPSLYLAVHDNEFHEPEFLNEVARRTGCGLLLDVNNVAVSAYNLAYDPAAYLAEIDMNLVGEIHLAGHETKTVGPRFLRIDDHGSTVSQEVWTLYQDVIRDRPAIPTLIEWDSNIPPLSTLQAEAHKADLLMDQLTRKGGKHASSL
ncbi:MAG: hypothetical protein C0605_07130 [Hyphomicrobiales bacterium]|nr:MAG: hypothetical protein C0605_07130 [Hyphomicrobiales bacterium]